MNTEISKSSQCYGLYDKNTLIGFCAVIHFPYKNNSKIKHIHRLVIHPDYQGIGLGKKLLNFVANIYNRKGFDTRIITSSRNLIYGLKNDIHWGCTFYGRMTKQAGKTQMNKTSSKERITASFKYIG